MIVIGAIIALLCSIVGSAIYANGGILLLDFIPTPHAPLSFADPFVTHFLQGLVGILGYALASKVFFVGVLIAAMWLGVLLARWIAKKFGFTDRVFGEIVGIVFFAANPFAYERMLAQPTIYAGIIALGYGLYFVMRGNFIRSGIAFAVGLAFFPHASYMILLILFGYFIFFASWRVFFGVLASGCIAIFLNLNWILAPLAVTGNSIGMIDGFDLTNFGAFATQSLAPMNVYLTTLMLYGFWGEQYVNHAGLVGNMSTSWYIGGFLVLLLVGLGGVLLWNRGEKRVLGFFSLLFLVSLICGIGIASPWLTALTLWMIDVLPGWQGYREPQKWIGITMIVEGILTIAGSMYIITKFRQDKLITSCTIVGVFLTLFIWSPGAYSLYHGQLRTTSYPVEFEAIRESLLGEKETPKILALPWHSYMSCDWMGRPSLANPLKGLLSPLSVTMADNIEVGTSLYSNSRSEESHNVERFLLTRDIRYISQYGYTHILLMMNCGEDSLSEWIGTIPSCQSFFHGEQAVVYSCNE